LEFDFQDNVYRALPFTEFDWLEHGFGTRSFPAPEPLATLRQIHSDIACYAARPGCLGEGDALLTDVAGLWVGVKTADCVPILLVDTRTRAVAAIHAGWRGTVARIAEKTAVAMMARWGSRPSDLQAAIGPGIGKCCFEVGPEVAIEFGQAAIRTYIDLPESNRRQLIEAGVVSKTIYTAKLCTVCHPAEFHSFRRDREKAGRMISVIRVNSVNRETRRARE
jgi:YfiH family protein